MSHSRRLAMSSVLLLSILGASSGAHHCPVWREIAPCKCHYDFGITSIACDNMTSFEQVAALLEGRFHPLDRVSLALSASGLQDLEHRAFDELDMSIENLKLNKVQIGKLNPRSFEGLTKMRYLSLADNSLGEVPQKLWKLMPKLETIDLGRSKITTVTSASFADLKSDKALECIMLPGNQISKMDTDSIPRQIKKLHIGRNHIERLNGTLRSLSELRWLFVNNNLLADLEGQLPRDAPNLGFVHASHNFIERLPDELNNYPALETVFFQNNKLKSLDGAISKCVRLKRAVLEHNRIDTISEDDFAETELLESLLLGHNEITSLNNSLLGLRHLHFLNLAYNRLGEFSFQEVADLRELEIIDLSYNRIEILTGPATNLVDWNSKLIEIKLEHNNIETLNGALSGFSDLLRLNLSFNRLKKLSPEDLIGLEQLRLLDVSHNHLTTLEETSKTYLPRLSELKASHNYLTILERDFHGLPVLCHADLSNNAIVALGKDLVAKTRCTIEHGVHEGTWDTLKIYLQDNPILCDAALPDIMSIMEINHTRIYGVSHNCPPLSEQPTTSKPTAFFGYLPESSSSLPTANDGEYQNEQNLGVNGTQRIAVAEDEPKIRDSIANGTELFDPVQQGKQINKLASELEELRTRIDELSSQNKLLLQTQVNSSIEHSSDNLTELRKP